MIDLLPHGLSVKLNVREPSDFDCVVFVERVLLAAYGVAAPSLDWTALSRIYPDLPAGRVSAQHAWGPVLAAKQLHVTTTETFPYAPPVREVGRWHVCQGWTAVDADGGVSPSRGAVGHTWLWLEVAPGFGCALDSARGRGVRLDGYRGWGDFVGRFARGGRVSVAVGVLA